MVTYRPGFKGPHNGKHLRVDKHRDMIFSDEANAHTDWMPCQAGSTIILMAHAARLQNQFRNGVKTGQSDVIRLNSAPIGSVTLKHKLGGEIDEHAAMLGSWRDITVAYNQPIQMSGFVRVEFGCMRGQPSSDRLAPDGLEEPTPQGIFVELRVTKS